MATSSLPVLALQHPLILLPTARFTVPINQQIGDAILDLIDHSEALPVIAAVPLTTPDSDNSITAQHQQHSPTAEWGTAARVLRLVKPPARNPRQPYLVSLHGLTRVRLIHTHVQKDKLSFLADSLPAFDVEYPPTEKVPTRETIDRFKQAALRLLDRLARNSVQPARKEGYTKIANMLDDIADARTPWLADVLVGSINTDYADKLAVLSTPDTTARLNLVSDIFFKQASISEVSKKIASAVDESLSKQQKEFFLRQQLAAIQRELSALQRGVNASPTNTPASADGSSNSNNNGSGVSDLDDDEQHEADDLADLKKKIEAMENGSEERKMGVREWRRLKRIPQGSVENGVIRSYLEWLTSIPWPNSSAPSLVSSAIRDKAFLTNARAQLDADHFGLEKIKKRLIEYLAVVRLKELNAEKEAREAVAITATEETAKQAATAANSSPSSPPQDTSTSSESPSSTPSPTSSPTPTPTLQQQPPQPNSNPRKQSSASTKGPILLFVGPPGTGKTSLGQSIARALNRPFQRIALGGVRDEAEIRGHRRTYVASGPGLIVQALRKSGRLDPIILLDEVDKIGQSNFHGDPGAALLEVLDPEQNWGFNDHYINVPIDLSQVLFICTANSLDTISAPLLDRCEIVHLAGYSGEEKCVIAKRFLVPKQIERNGLKEGMVVVEGEVLKEVVSGWTREAGVRSLERCIGALVRFKAVKWAEWVEKCEKEGKEVYIPEPRKLPDADADSNSDGETYNPLVLLSSLDQILGLPPYHPSSSSSSCETPESRLIDHKKPGIIYGLVVMGQGEGGILPVETLLLPGGKGQLKLTGSLGEVIKESGELALSWVRRFAWDLGIVKSRLGDCLRVGEAPGLGLSPPNSALTTKVGSAVNVDGGSARSKGESGWYDVHLHLPAGAQKKDGPSAGVAMTCALVSLLTGCCVPPNIAMTGEITLRGKVTPVGGIKEKVLGAHRAGITKVILPYANRKEVEYDVPREVKEEIEFAFVGNLGEALEEAFGAGVVEGWRTRWDRRGGRLRVSERGRGDEGFVSGEDEEVDVYERRGVGVLVESRL